MTKTSTIRNLVFLLSGMLNMVLLPGAFGQQDTLSPATPELEAITVDPVNGYVHLEWMRSMDPDVLGYIIYRSKNDVWIAIDSLYHASDSTYTDMTSGALYFPESYAIAAFDTSRNFSPFGTPHTTVFLEARYDTCQAALLLSWSPYIGWQDINGYQVLIRENSDPYFVVDTVTGSSTGDTLKDLSSGNSYCVYVSALGPGEKVSFSNGRCLAIEMLQPPSYITSSGALVTDNHMVTLSFTPDPSGELTHFTLYRSLSPEGMLSAVTDMTVNPGETFTITDDLDTITSPVYYTLAAINPCGKAVTYSNPATAIFLNGTNDGLVNLLDWSVYRDFPEGTDFYTLFRSTDNMSWTPVATVAGSDTTFADDITALQYTTENAPFYCYMVEATGKNSSSYPSPLTSRSTTICLAGTFNLFVPNVFTPDRDGKNDTFAPVLSFAPRSYRMIIRNRWGKILFDTTDYLQSWDGTDSSGKAVPEGTYTYFIRLTTPEDKTITRTGSITIIFP